MRIIIYLAMTAGFFLLSSHVSAKDKPLKLKIGNYNMDCKKQIKSVLHDKLITQDESQKTSLSLKEIEEAYQSTQPAYGIAGQILKLKDPQSGVNLLKKILQDKNGLVVIEAAAALALIGSSEGVNQLQDVKSFSNSNIEFFYAKAALIILNQPIPEKLKKNNSVFLELNKLIDECFEKKSQ